MGIVSIMIIYLAAINILGGILFCIDKLLAIRGSRRIRERTLHSFEAMGGALVMMPLMYVIRHKYKKPSYYMVSWLLCLLWLVLLVLVLWFRWHKMNI